MLLLTFMLPIGIIYHHPDELIQTIAEPWQSKRFTTELSIQNCAKFVITYLFHLAYIHLLFVISFIYYAKLLSN